MHIVSAAFLCSATGPDQGAGWPVEGPPEVAFVGRSNVGKSSLMNALMRRKDLVRVSHTPGRTRLINFFEVQVAGPGGVRPLRLVDLPGFGYAKVSKAEREAWRPFVQRYLEGRRSLAAVVLLVDLRRGPETEERELAEWLSGLGRPLVVVATKADKAKKHERKPLLAQVERGLSLKALAVSVQAGEGIDALSRRLLAVLPPST
jgi:GTP-binding protein